MHKDIDSKKRIAVITGASSGIGKATAELFAANGITVVNVDIAEPVNPPTNNYFYFRKSVVCVEDVQQLFSLVIDEVGTPDILICNAGKGIHEKLSEGDPEKRFNVINVNLMGTLRVLRSFLPSLISQGGADIIFISSVAAKHPYEYGGIYGATKAAIEAIAQTLRLELSGSGRVTVIEPGVVDTGFFSNLESGQINPVGIGYGALHPTDVAEAILFAVTREAHQVVNNITLRPRKQLF